MCHRRGAAVADIATGRRLRLVDSLCGILKQLIAALVDSGVTDLKQFEQLRNRRCWSGTIVATQAEFRRTVLRGENMSSPAIPRGRARGTDPVARYGCGPEGWAYRPSIHRGSVGTQSPTAGCRCQPTPMGGGGVAGQGDSDGVTLCPRAGDPTDPCTGACLAGGPARANR